MILYISGLSYRQTRFLIGWDFIMKMISLISQLAISMLTAIFICGVIGYGIDYYCGTNVLVFFLILGVLGGYRSCYSIICKFLGKDSLFDKSYNGYEKTAETEIDVSDENDSDK